MALRCLVTNDDGIHSEGLRLLARAAVARGLEVTVVAPSFDASGSSASMTAMATDGHVVIDPVQTECAVPVMTLHGPPAFIVRAAMFGAFGAPPDVVLAGINRGLNTGRAVLHSGTVGAALTAANYGRRALAVSAAVSGESWSAAEGSLARAIDWVLAAPAGTVLNVNVPATEGGELEVRTTVLAEAGTVQGNVSQVTGGYVPVTFSDGEVDPRPDTDAAALAEGCISVTAIKAVTEDRTFDLGEVVNRTG